MIECFVLWMARQLERLQNAGLHYDLRRLRRDGHTIHDSATFGPRTRLHVAPGAHVAIGRGTRILHDCFLAAEEGDTLTIGEDVFISQHTTVSGSVTIGRDTLIAGFVTIIDATHVTDDPALPVRVQGGRKRPIDIGLDVWIGAGCVILQGVRIGDHAVIGANSTVTRDVPPWSVAAGSPARVIGERPQGAESQA
jgi:serine acetyltransferase